MTAGRPLKYKTVEALQNAIDLYFETDAYVGEGDNRRFIPTVAGLAYALGMSRQALCDYEAKGKFLDTIKRAKQKIEISLEVNLHNAAVTGTIFNLKNNFGWKDQTEQKLSGDQNNPIQHKHDVSLSPSEAYLKMIGK